MSHLIKAPKRHEEEMDDWLLTYADMVTLLFAFFVLLFSISTLDPKELGMISNALKERGFVEDQLAHEDPFEELTKEIELSLGASGYDQYMVVSTKDDTIEIELSSSSFYLPGSAKFTKEAIPMLDQVVPSLVKLVANGNVVVEVEGHTDSSPISTPQFPSNWELSAARAANTVRFFIARGVPANKLKAIGFGDTQPKAENTDPTGAPIPANQELNRRVVVKVVKAD
jgi:chemotaxis protein MotB